MEVPPIHNDDDHARAMEQIENLWGADDERTAVDAQDDPASQNGAGPLGGRAHRRRKSRRLSLPSTFLQPTLRNPAMAKWWSKAKATRILRRPMITKLVASTADSLCRRYKVPGTSSVRK